MAPPAAKYLKRANVARIEEAGLSVEKSLSCYSKSDHMTFFAKSNKVKQCHNK